MSYLERNHQLIAEMEETHLTLQRGVIIGEGNQTRFVAVGSYQSSLLGSRLYLGLKELKDPKTNFTYGLRCHYRASQELAIMERIAKKLPYLLPALPVCYALLVGKDRQILGVVMEDFSQGNSLQLYPSAPLEKMRDLFVEDTIDRETLDNLAIWINTGGSQKEKLMDFFPLFKKDFGGDGVELNRRRLHLTAVEQAIRQGLYTLHIDYEL